MNKPKRSSGGLQLVPRPTFLPQPTVQPKSAVLPNPGWETAAQGWSACVLLLCVCGWSAEMNDSQVATCSNPACPCRTRAFNVRVTITEVSCTATI